MRFHKKRTVRPYVERKVKVKTETRDAVIWSLDETQRIAWVRIQGSDELINAHFPQNQKVLPSFARQGNSVILRHREGQRGYVEIIGEGRAIPSPIDGISHPGPIDLEDVILSGLDMYPTTPAQMGVYITNGSYRIGGTIYYFVTEQLDYIVMDDPAAMAMESSTNYILGAGNFTVAIEPGCASSGEWRYDLLQIGTDSVIDYISGECAAGPDFPNVSDNHLQVGDYIFVSWETSAIEAYNIGHTMDVQEARWLTMDFTAIAPAVFDAMPPVFRYCADGACATYPNPECYVNVNIKDQSGLECFPGGAGFNLTLTKSAGTGTIYSEDSGWGSTTAVQFLTDAGTYAFRYKRDETITETSPVFIGSLSSTNNLTIPGMFYLEVSGEDFAPFG